MRDCSSCGLIYGQGTVFCARDDAPLRDRPGLKGRAVGPYLADALLGEGAMAAVFAARRADGAGGRMALKILFGEIALDEVLAARFAREARLTASLGHPNIVETVDAGHTGDGLMYLAMERVEGETLAARIERAGAVPEDEARRILRGIAAGLDFAHGQGVVHRDLKAENVMLVGAGEPKILDFGLAGVLHEHLSSQRLTRTGSSLGTPLYMAPEQFTSAAATPAGDLYALGILAYELLVGRPPFEGSIAQVAFAKIADRFEPPPEAGGLGPLTAELMRADPSARPPSAAEVLRRLG
jgi:serine/threonine protein kinase